MAHMLGGDYNESSDIDIMILVDLDENEIENVRDEIYDLAYDLEWDYDFKITLSPLIKNVDKFNYWLEVKPFYMNVNREGVVLHG